MELPDSLFRITADETFDIPSTQLLFANFRFTLL